MIIHQQRSGLCRTRQKIAAGAPVTLGFLGGSITDGRVPYNWPEPVIAWFIERFPQNRIQVENAAIGATGSDLAVFLAEPHILAHDCDLVFVEFAVNDGGEPPTKRARTREGLLRKLLAGAGRDVLLTYTFGQDMYTDMLAGMVPATIGDFEVLAAHYGISSVWMGLHALREVQAGRMRWEEWLPDGLHPQFRGSWSYAQAVTGLLECLLCGENIHSPLPVGSARPSPLDRANWESAMTLPLSAVTLEGPWQLKRWPAMKWIDQVLESSAPGARLAFAFTGSGLTLGFDFGRNSSEFRYRIDGGEWVVVNRERPDWCGAEGWYRLTMIAGDLPLTPHQFELEVLHGNGPNCTGTTCRVALIGILP